MKQSEVPAARIPDATYRVQFNGGFGFRDAEAIIPYLHELGISDLYASPYLKAREGSSHGYDVVDQNSLNPEVGSDGEFEALVAELRRFGMGQILDIVPNHMCVEGSGNAYWQDLLENGPSSLHALFFDIDWNPVKKELANKVLIPILGDQYGDVLERGELVLSFTEAGFVINYYEHRLPVIPKTYSSILTLRLDELEGELSADHPQVQELLSIVTALKHLPFYTETDPELIVERYREKEVVKRRLWSLYQESSEVRGFIDRNIALFNGRPGEPASFDLLDDLLRQQVYRLSHWRVATEEINYRRFFDINSLGAIRMEEPAVFEETHRLIFRLVREGTVTGLRIDHADGLYDPSDYLHRLQRGCFLQLRRADRERELGRELTGEELSELAEETRRMYEEKLMADPGFKPFHIVGEKILIKGEKLPESWPVFSTTGYGFANAVTGLLVDSRNARLFDAIYSRFIREKLNFHEIAYENKKLVMQVSMSSEVNTLGHYLNTISETNRHTRDFTLISLIKALVEVVAFFPVYRTYTSGFTVNDRDRQYVEQAVAKAKRKNPATDDSIFDFIRDVLLLRFPESLGEPEQREWLNFVMKFQQVTGPVMAKGLEDTAFYVFNRLVSLNEVGGVPERFGVPLESFHGQNIERAKGNRRAMLATATHDTKRGEDVRARISVLSEMPETWREFLVRWSRFNRYQKAQVDGQPVPDRNEEYLLYQTLIGTWPVEPVSGEEFVRFRERIKAYMQKAGREAKVNTSWVNPNIPHEEGVALFIDAILRDSPKNHFLEDIRKFQATVAQYGMFNSLSQTLLKITSPGFPDIYQGTELWDLSLVDPDNRRPVDYGLRRRLLDELRREETDGGILPLARRLVAERNDGRIKLWLLWKGLNFRRDNPGLFAVGSYLPLEAAGEKSEHVCAFERSLNGASAMVVAPRFFTRLMDGPFAEPCGRDAWGDTVLVVPGAEAGGLYRNVLTGELLTVETLAEGAGFRMAMLLSSFPVALLEWVG